MDRYIDMQHLKRKYSDAWASMNREVSKTSSDTVMLATTHLLFEIIQDLISREEIEVADAILNSTSNPRWQTEKNLDQGIETVRDFPAGLSIENRGDMFTLDRSHDGRLYQCWIIDRVMRKGGFWVGTIVDETASTDLQKTPGINDEEPLAIDTETSVENDNKIKPKFTARGHQSSLLSRVLLSKMISHFNNTKDESEEKDGVEVDSFMLEQGDLLASLAFVLGADRGATSKQKSERRAVFDVDGDTTGSCLIFQPYHMMLESIPRPALRSMSVSWRVERLKDGKSGSTEHDAGLNTKNRQESLTTIGPVKGMWRYNGSVIGSRYLLV